MDTTSGILRRLPLVFWLDSALLAALLLLLAPRMTGLPIHEWIGISFCAPVLIHVLLSWRWIVATLRSLPSRTTRTRINVLINTALFVLTVIEIVSGLVISRVALPLLGLHTIEDGSWRALHNQALNFTKLAVGLHIAMNWRWIVSALARRSASINKRIRTVAWIPVNTQDVTDPDRRRARWPGGVRAAGAAIVDARVSPGRDHALHTRGRAWTRPVWGRGDQSPVALRTREFLCSDPKPKLAERARRSPLC
ncbi:MAG TPA: DUF4405 domain-containing protein [Thermoanaerobaculia bacterium]|nr:DUF4405 domain-containing protein [Thermoanaerobaculia bacterium]